MQTICPHCQSCALLFKPVYCKRFTELLLPRSTVSVSSLCCTLYIFSTTQQLASVWMQVSILHANHRRMWESGSNQNDHKRFFSPALYNSLLPISASNGQKPAHVYQRVTDQCVGPCDWGFSNEFHNDIHRSPLTCNQLGNIHFYPGNQCKIAQCNSTAIILVRGSQASQCMCAGKQSTIMHN